MPDQDHPTRQRLLDTGLVLAETTPLTALSIDTIVAEAGVAKGTFYVHFSDRATYLAALHQRFHDRLRDQMRLASTGLAPGRARLAATAVAFLDACLDQRGVKAMLLEGRADVTVADAVHLSNDRFARSCAGDFDAIGRRLPLESARLFIAATAETALLELHAGRRLPRQRDALIELLD